MGTPSMHKSYCISLPLSISLDHDENSNSTKLQILNVFINFTIRAHILKTLLIAKILNAAYELFTFAN